MYTWPGDGCAIIDTWHANTGLPDDCQSLSQSIWLSKHMMINVLLNLKTSDIYIRSLSLFFVLVLKALKSMKYSKLFYLNIRVSIKYSKLCFQITLFAGDSRKTSNTLSSISISQFLVYRDEMWTHVPVPDLFFYHTMTIWLFSFWSRTWPWKSTFRDEQERIKVQNHKSVIKSVLSFCMSTDAGFVLSETTSW